MLCGIVTDADGYVELYTSPLFFQTLGVDHDIALHIFMAKQLWYQDVADQLRSETKVM